MARKLLLTHSSSADAYSAYGHEGVIKAIQILKDEMEMKWVTIALVPRCRS